MNKFNQQVEFKIGNYSTSNIINGYSLPNLNYDRNYELIEKFNKTWYEWLQPTLLNKTNFKYHMPINGIVEAIEKICSSQDYERYVIFEGEVKYYENILKIYKKKFIKIKYNQLDKIENNDLVCCSMPFSPFGSIPEWYSDLCSFVEEKNIPMFIDGAYLGTVNKKVYIPTTCIFFAASVTKCFNAPALRSGILMFDNLLSTFCAKYKLANYNYYSMEKAITLLNNFDCFYTYNKYIKQYLKFCSTNNLEISDSVVLAYTYNFDHKLKNKMQVNNDLKILRLGVSSHI